MTSNDLMPEPPPPDYDDWGAPDELYTLPDDPFPDDLFTGTPDDCSRWNRCFTLIR